MVIDSGGWFPVHQSFMKLLGVKAAVLLHFLINYQQRVKVKLGSWFFCTVEKMEDELLIGIKEQRKQIAILVDFGLLEVQKRGGPPARRHFKLNTKRIIEVVEEWAENTSENYNDDESGLSSQSLQASTETSSEASSSQSLQASSQYSNKISSKKRPSKKNSFSKRKRAAEEGGHLLSSDFDRSNAAKLRSILIKHGSPLIDPAILSRNGRKPVGLKRLANGFFQLRIDLGVSEKEISDFLDWYEIHYSDEFTPSLYKADDLILKWSKLKDAWRRSESASGNGRAKQIAATNKRVLDELAEEEGW
jgi:hypothetical protein